MEKPRLKDKLASEFAKKIAYEKALDQLFKSLPKKSTNNLTENQFEDTQDRAFEKRLNSIFRSLDKYQITNNNL